MGVVVIVIFYRCRNVSLLFSSSIGKLSSFIGSCFQSFFLLQYFWFYINPSLCFLHRFVTWQFSFQLILSRFLTSVIDFTSLLNSQFFYLSIPLTESFPLSLFVTLCSYFSIYITFSLRRSFYLFISFSLSLAVSLFLSLFLYIALYLSFSLLYLLFVLFLRLFLYYSLYPPLLFSAPSLYVFDFFSFCARLSDYVLLCSSVPTTIHAPTPLFYFPFQPFSLSFFPFLSISLFTFLFSYSISMSVSWYERPWTGSTRASVYLLLKVMSTISSVLKALSQISPHSGKSYNKFYLQVPECYQGVDIFAICHYSTHILFYF